MRFLFGGPMTSLIHSTVDRFTEYAIDDSIYLGKNIPADQRFQFFIGESGLSTKEKIAGISPPRFECMHDTATGNLYAVHDVADLRVFFGMVTLFNPCLTMIRTVYQVVKIICHVACLLFDEIRDNLNSSQVFELKKLKIKIEKGFVPIYEELQVVKSNILASFAIQLKAMEAALYFRNPHELHKIKVIIAHFECFQNRYADYRKGFLFRFHVLNKAKSQQNGRENNWHDTLEIIVKLIRERPSFYQLECCQHRGKLDDKRVDLEAGCNVDRVQIQSPMFFSKQELHEFLLQGQNPV